MSMDIGKQLQQLARREQMKMWLKRLNARLPALLWLSASALAVGGCIHQLLSPMDPLAVTCIAIAPSLSVLLWTAFTETPTAVEGAAAADRLFGANSLFVSAWELTRSAAAIEGIGPLLTARTETALPAWRQRKRAPQKHDMNPASLIAVTLGLAGLFFLLLPSHTRTTDASYAAPSMSMQPGHRTESSDRALSELFTPPEVTAAKAPEQNLEREASLAPSSPDASQSPMQDDQKTADSARELSDQTARQTVSRDDTATAAAQTALPSTAETEGRKVPDRTPGDQEASDTGKTIAGREQFEQSRADRHRNRRG